MRMAIGATAACLSIIGLSNAADVEAAIKRRTDIPAQGLAPALRDLAKDRGFQIVFASEEVGDLRTPGAVGDLTTSEALAQLLSGTGLTYRYLDDDTITIAPVSARAPSSSEGLPSGSESQDPARSVSDEQHAPARDGDGRNDERATNVPRGKLRLAQNDQGAPGAGNAAQRGAAQESMRLETLEEIIVTAERRQERAQDVPISMSVFSGDFVRQQGGLAEDIANLTANYQMTATAGGTGFIENNTTIRGLGASEQNNPLASTSNLVYYDGVASGTAFTSIMPPWDLARIEVARGPQGTLFGRNAVAGLVQYVSAAPTDTFEGYGQLTFGEFDLMRFEGALSAPLSDTVNVRVSALGYDRDGDVTNTFLNTEVGAMDWWGGRVILDWQPADATSLRMKYQRFEGTAGRTALNAAPRSTIPAGGLAFLDAIGEDPDATRNSDFESTRTAYEDAYDKVKFMDLAELDLNHNFGSVALDFVAGYLAGESFRDFNNLEYPELFAQILNATELEQWSGEVRLTSQSESPFQWIGGLYYQQAEDSFDRAVDFTPILRDLDGDGRSRANPNSPEDLLDGITPNPGFAGAATIMQEGGNEQELETYAAFLHTTYEWTDRLTTTHAVRHTHEKKDMAYRYLSLFEFPVSPGVTAGTPAQRADFMAFANLTHAQRRALALRILSDPNTRDANGNVIPAVFSESWDELTWRFAIDYKLTPDVLLYTSVSKGFRGGIFSVLATPAAAASADPETSTVYEIGTKTTWLDQRLTLNVSAFYNDHRDYQTTLLVINAQGGVFNATENLPKTRLYGGEIELQMIAFDGLFLAAGLGLMESEIREVLPGNEAILGNELPFAEDVNFSGRVGYDFSSGLGVFTPEVSWLYRGEYWSKKENNDVTGVLGNFWTADVRLRYVAPGGAFFGQVYMKNVFDEVQPVLNNFPPNTFLGVSSFSSINQRRNWGVTVGYRF